MTHTVTNRTAGPVYATVEGTSYEVLAGDSLDVDSPRLAMILGEYGLTVERKPLDKALADAYADPAVETLVSPWSEHGPGTDQRGRIVDEDAASAYVKATSGDTSKTTAQIAAASALGAVVVEPGDGETVSSTGEVTDADGTPAGEAPRTRKGRASTSS